MSGKAALLVGEVFQFCRGALISSITYAIKTKLSCPDSMLIESVRSAIKNKRFSLKNPNSLYDIGYLGYATLLIANA